MEIDKLERITETAVDILGNITMICIEISMILAFTIGTILFLSYLITQF